MGKTMRERIARAICPEAWVSDERGYIAPRAEEQQRRALNQADAALAAMREPTEVVNDAGTSELCDTEEYDLDVRFFSAWQAAIDAARNEQPDKEAG
jgi:hypothetical protein